MLRVFSSLWQAVGGSESRKQFVASLQVPDAEQPGIVHGGAGLDDHARGQARRYAALGYVAPRV